jgi:glycosyltransferase involved in cell wall biosynthesis
MARENLNAVESAKKKSPFFTVLIDTYNYGQYIEDAIESVLAQDFPQEECEIIVVDDGSTDDTEQRLKKFSENILYFRKPNGGQASAFNFGFERARGEVIALLDADDLWLPGKLKRVHQAFQQDSKFGIVYHRVRMWDGSRDLGEDSYFAEVSGWIPGSRRTLLSYPMTGSSSLAFRRGALEKLLPIPEGLKTQADAYLTGLIIFVSPVLAIPEFLGKYRLHGGNLYQAQANSAPASQIENRIETRKILLQGIEGWLAKAGSAVDRADARLYLRQWSKAQERDSYLLKAPGRLEYFRHLAEFSRIYSPIMSRKHVLFSHARALAALVLGYHRLHLFDDLYAKMKSWSRAKRNSAVALDDAASMIEKG